MTLSLKEISNYGYDVLELYTVYNILRYDYAYKNFNMFKDKMSFYGLLKTSDVCSDIIKCLIDNFYNTPNWNAVLSEMKNNIQSYAKEEKKIITYYPSTPTPVLGEFKYIIETECYEYDLDLLTIRPNGFTNVSISKMEKNDKNIIIIVKCDSDGVKRPPITISTTARWKL